MHTSGVRVSSAEGCNQGTAILFNEFKGRIQIQFVIFPYIGDVQAIWGFFQLRVDNKIVEIHKSKDAGERCLVYLLDLYLAKIPQCAKDKGTFYCKPL